MLSWPKSKQKNRIKTALIIPSFERGSHLAYTLEKVRKLTTLPDEIWIMEQSNEPNPGTRRLCDLIPTKVFLQTHLKPGAQAARNKAARETEADILLFLDDDVDPEPDLIHAHLENYQDSLVDAVAGFYLEPGDRETSEARKTAWWRPLTFLEKYPASHIERVNSPLWPSCNGSIRREVFLKLGGFDENYRYTLLDDTDLAVRMQKAGYRCVHDPKARLFHRKEPTGGNRPVKPGDKVIANREKWYTWFYFFLMNYGLFGLGEILSRMRTNVFRRPYFQVPSLLLLAMGEMTVGLGQAVRSIAQGRRLMREDD